MLRSQRINPLLKWAGGKESELPHILPIIPANFNRYFEPFVGGGAVYFAIDAEAMFINDKSSELMNLYCLVRENNTEFAQALDDINNSWLRLSDVVSPNIEELSALYRSYSLGRLSNEIMEERLIEYTITHADQFVGLLPSPFTGALENFAHEIRRNLVSKTSRMKVLEHSKGLLGVNDVHDNLECALKSAYYMHFRHLYNHASRLDISLPVLTAIFYFIREYCYSSMFRYNAKGEFNVPYGGISYNRKDLGKKIQHMRSREVQDHLAKTGLHCLDFEDFLRQTSPRQGDFLFIDPPYDSDFSTYAQNSFNQEDHARLAAYLLNDCRASFMLVIKNTDFISGLYCHKGLNVSAFSKKYTVSFQNRNLKDTEHIVITNY